MRTWRMRLAAVAVAVIAALGLAATPAQAASVDYMPILSWPGNTKIGDRWTVYFDRNETANMAAGGAAAASRQLSRTGMHGVLVGLVAGGAASLAHHAVSQSGKCVTVRAELFWGWLPNVSTWLRNC